jgi:hypothetical protein
MRLEQEYSTSKEGRGSSRDPNVYSGTMSLVWFDGRPIQNATVGFACHQPTASERSSKADYKDCLNNTENMSQLYLIKKTNERGQVSFRYPLKSSSFYGSNFLQGSDWTTISAKVLPECSSPPSTGPGTGTCNADVATGTTGKHIRIIKLGDPFATR